MSYTPVEGKIRAIRDHVLITDMEFDEVKTESGIVLPSQDGKDTGIRPRWGKVYAIGPEQKDVQVGEWIYVEHGRWTRGIKVKDESGEELVIRRVDTDNILLQSDEKPSDIYMAKL
jgi:co-chaperonin GroES (HSP10)